MSTQTYAARTEVAPERSRAEIEHLLAQAGASGFLYGWHEQRAVLGFSLHARKYRFVLELPDRSDRRFTHTAHKQRYQQQQRTKEAAEKAYQQEVRRAWRELALLIKAKLVACASGLVSVEEEFLAYALTPSGQTVSEWLGPQLDDAAAHGQLPLLLPPGI
jgi:hypothetical protein